MSQPPPIPQPAQKAIRGRWSRLLQSIVAVSAFAAWIVFLLVTNCGRQSESTVATGDSYGTQSAAPSTLPRDPNVADKIKILQVHARWRGSVLYTSADWLNMSDTPIRQVYGRFEASDEDGALVLSAYDWLYYGDGSEEPDAPIQPKMAYRVRDLTAEGETFDRFDFRRQPRSSLLLVQFIPTQAYATLETSVEQNR